MPVLYCLESKFSFAPLRFAHDWQLEVFKFAMASVKQYFCSFFLPSRQHNSFLDAGCIVWRIFVLCFSSILARSLSLVSSNVFWPPNQIMKCCSRCRDICPIRKSAPVCSIVSAVVLWRARRPRPRNEKRTGPR